MSEEDILLSSACCLIIDLLSKKRHKKRRFWERTLFKRRNLYSGTNLLTDFRMEDSSGFKNFCRMSAADFEYLLTVIGPKISKRDTNCRSAIPVRDRLAITLRFLATGDSYTSLMYLFKVSKQLISAIVPEVCTALITELQEYIQIPHSPELWCKIAQSFDERWNFPHCLGAIDGKHVVLQAPIKGGTEYVNYKGQYSIVLLAVVDASYSFICVDVGCQGRISDGNVLKNAKFFSELCAGNLHLPTDNALHGRIKPVPFVFIADDTFPQQNHIIKPYPRNKEVDSKKRIFNYQLSRAYRTVENAFGILSAVFQVLRKPLLLQPEKAKLVILSCVVLHNFLQKRDTSRNIYNPPGTFDMENDGEVIGGGWRKEAGEFTSFLPLNKGAKKSAVSAQEIRDEFAEYFSTSGCMP